ncbi:MAG: hypothetical protein RMM98_12960 [Acidobacteriota bacterium]|nr:hypothetical protein [Blastocatellia bacterium]MDW8240515.1 hypothetical protein [Acidobacteriota bacterium]
MNQGIERRIFCVHGHINTEKIRRIMAVPETYRSVAAFLAGELDGSR